MCQQAQSRGRRINIHRRKKARQHGGETLKSNQHNSKVSRWAAAILEDFLHRCVKGMCEQQAGTNKCMTQFVRRKRASNKQAKTWSAGKRMHTHGGEHFFVYLSTRCNNDRSPHRCSRPQAQKLDRQTNLLSGMSISCAWATQHFFFPKENETIRIGVCAKRMLYNSFEMVSANISHKDFEFFCRKNSCNS